jgi:hypothetical protein
MRIRRTVIVLMLALLTIPVLAGPASAGGRPTPPPTTWLGDAIVAALVAVGAFFLSVVAIGIAKRREPR